MKKSKKLIALVLTMVLLLSGCALKSDPIVGEWINAKKEIVSISADRNWKMINSLGGGTWENVGKNKYLFVDTINNKIEATIEEDENGKYIDLLYYGKFYQNNTTQKEEINTNLSNTSDSEKNYTVTKTYQTYDGVGLIDYTKNDGTDKEYTALASLEGEVFYFSNECTTDNWSQYENGIGYYSYYVEENGDKKSYFELINCKGKGILNNQSSDFDEILALGNGMALLYRYISTVNTFEHQYAIINSSGSFIFPWTSLDMYDSRAFQEATYLGENIFSVSLIPNHSYMLINADTGKIIYVYNTVPTHFSSGKTYLSPPLSSYHIAKVSISMTSLGDFVSERDGFASFVALNKDGTYQVIQEFDTYTDGRVITFEKDFVNIYDTRNDTTVRFTEYPSQVEKIEFYGDIGIVTIRSADRQKTYFTAIDKNGKKLFEPIQYDDMSYSEKFFFYQVGETYNIANLNGETLSLKQSTQDTDKFGYSDNLELNKFDNGILATDKGGGYINSKGEPVVVNFNF